MNQEIIVPIVLLVMVTSTTILAIRSHRIKKVFGIPWYCLLLSADIAGQKAGKPLKKDGVIGSPDGIFFDPIHWSWIICELKSRRFNKKYTLRERYQIQLYLGMARTWYCRRVTGRLTYSGGTFLVPFEQQTYRALLSLIPETVEVTKSWKLSDPRPLHRRQHIPRVKYPVLEK